MVTCQTNYIAETPFVIPVCLDEPLSDSNFVCSIGYTIDSLLSEYDVSPKASYSVYGLIIYDGMTRYLIDDDKNIPILCPAELFAIKKGNLHWDWKAKQYSVNEKSLLLIGYPAEISYEDFISLVARKNNAIEKFLQYKEYLNQYGDLLN